MRLLRNTGAERVIDLLAPELQRETVLDIVSPGFSLFAFSELVRWMEPEKPTKPYYYVNRYVESYDLAFSRDGRYIATCGYWVWVWDVATGKMVARINEGKLQSGTLRALFFDPSGELLYTGGDAGIFKWRWGRPKEGAGVKERKGGQAK